MARGGGLALKTLQWVLRIIEFCCAAIILAIFSYFLATLHNHNLSIATYIRAVEGISGAAVLYTVIGWLLVCCLAGFALTSGLAILLDVAFAGAFIYIAWATRGGAGTCSGTVDTPFGSGDTNSSNSVDNGSGGFTILPSLKTACRLETACFAVAIVAIIFFLLSALVEMALIKHHRKEKAFGPSPNNGYTAGSARSKFRLWPSRKRKAEYGMAGGLAVKPDALPTHTTPADVRASYATDATAVGNEPVYNKYSSATPVPAHHTAANPYAAPNQVSGVTRPYQNGNF
ncbi:hypothetical protein BP6252_01211 [Coleophoma cylindrospora]|uniref:MARVEL domain-containing protein n=1 Tax=Coleophoma cylindrospora TaxID=1849047 RepID=A0A3D8SS83_9HELO|nr:hypothetical protein BP6252_01211 [Coleophoma cylindrospora]